MPERCTFGGLSSENSKTEMDENKNKSLILGLMCTIITFFGLDIHLHSCIIDTPEFNGITVCNLHA